MNELVIKRSCGRPAGRKKIAKIEISIEPEIKNKFMELLHAQGRTASVELCSWIRRYVESEERKNMLV